MVAIEEQPRATAISNCLAHKYVAPTMLYTGNILVISSMWKLGIAGTYLGDHFGILMDAKLTGFPFSITDHPMYVGSTLSFFGYALW